MSRLAPILDAVASGRALTSTEAEEAFGVLMDGEARDDEIIAFLTGLKERGETIEEIAAGAKVLRARCAPVAAPPGAIDTCGTGGDAAGTFNISTAVAFVAAGAGAVVAKHGNRAVSSKSGSAEVLAALGVKIDAGAAAAKVALREAGVAFLFAPAHHAAMRHVAKARAALKMRTIFNVIGPLANPAGARRQLLGVYDAAFVRPLAEALKALGAEKAWVVHGADGLDEITTTGATTVAALENGVVTEFEVMPEGVGLARVAPEALKGGAPEENAEAIRKLLTGEKGPFRDIVLLNAAAALVVADIANDLKDGAARAAAAIDDGEAGAALAKLVEITNRSQRQ